MKSDRDDALTAAIEGRDKDRKKIGREWARLTFEVTLAPSLLTSLEDQATWFKASGRPGSQAAAPKYRDLIHANLLR